MNAFFEKKHFFIEKRRHAAQKMPVYVILETKEIIIVAIIIKAEVNDSA